MADDNIASESNRKGNDLTWNNFKYFEHQYLVNVQNHPQRSCSEDVEYFHFPLPIRNPVPVKDFNLYRKLFKDIRKTESYMKYYQKLFKQDKILKSHLKKQIIELPKYVLDLAQNNEEVSHCIFQNYSGGVLDTFNLNDKDYIVNCAISGTVQVLDAYNSSDSIDLNIEKTMPVYCIKAISIQDNTLISMRHKHKTSVIRLTADSNTLNQDLICRTTSDNIYRDICFNPIQNNEFATVTDHMKLRVLDLNRSEVRQKYTFEVEHDNVVKIDYIDNDTVCFMNSSCVFFLDLRSLQTRKLCLKGSWLECDDLCHISKTKNNLYVTSKHNLKQLDMRILKQSSEVMHMLSSTPFMSCTLDHRFEEKICVFGQQINDRVLIRENGTLNTPMYISNNMDVLTQASLTHKFPFFEDLDQRMGLPILGAKLHKDCNTNTIVLYTSTAAGDIFKQNFNNNSGDGNDVEKLVEWIKLIRQEPSKTLEVTSVCNLDKMMYTIRNNFPNERNLRRLMGENVTEKPKIDFGDMSQYLQTGVGQAINAIWEEDEPLVGDPLPLSQIKVSDWLSSVL